jgi:hypothetical protein
MWAVQIREMGRPRVISRWQEKKIKEKGQQEGPGAWADVAMHDRVGDHLPLATTLAHRRKLEKDGRSRGLPAAVVGGVWATAGLKRVAARRGVSRRASRGGWLASSVSTAASPGANSFATPVVSSSPAAFRRSWTKRRGRLG